MKLHKITGMAMALLLTAAFLFTLSVGQSQARFENTVTVEAVFDPVELTSNYLVAGGAVVLLSDWAAPSAESSKVEYIQFYTDGGTAKGTLTCVSSHPELLTATVDKTNLSVTRSGQVTLKLTPTAEAAALEQAQPVQVRVEWQAEGTAEDEVQEQTADTAVYAVFLVNLVPAIPEDPDTGTDGPDVEEPGNEEPGTEEPGTEEPGIEEPGTEEPGTEEPGTEEPGTEEPGTGEPDTEEPGTEEPSTGDNSDTTEPDGSDDTTNTDDPADSEDSDNSAGQDETAAIAEEGGEADDAVTDNTDDPPQSGESGGSETQPDDSTDSQPDDNDPDESDPDDSNPDDSNPDDGNPDDGNPDGSEEPVVPVVPSITVTGPAIFAPTEPLVLRTTLVGEAAAVELLYNGGTFPEGTRYLVNGATCIIHGDEGVEAVLEVGETGLQSLEFDFSHAAALTEIIEITAASYGKDGAQLAQTTFAAAPTRAALTIQYGSQVIDSRAELVLPVTGDVEGFSWKLEHLIMNENGELVYETATEENMFGLTIALPDILTVIEETPDTEDTEDTEETETPEEESVQQVLTISNADGLAAAGTYRLTLQRTDGDLILRYIEFPFFIHY